MIHVVKRKFEPHPVETIIKKSTPEWLDIHVKVVSICQCVLFYLYIMFWWLVILTLWSSSSMSSSFNFVYDEINLNSFRATAKLGVVGGTVYFTAKEGLWGNSKETNDAYKRLKSKTLDEWLPASVDMKPSTSKKVCVKCCSCRSVALQEHPSWHAKKQKVSLVKKNLQLGCTKNYTCFGVIKLTQQVLISVTEKLFASAWVWTWLLLQSSARAKGLTH